MDVDGHGPEAAVRIVNVSTTPVAPTLLVDETPNAASGVHEHFRDLEPHSGFGNPRQHVPRRSNLSEACGPLLETAPRLAFFEALVGLLGSRRYILEMRDL